MASLALPAAAMASNSFGINTSPSHARRHSRNPSAAPLPAFSFNPGAVNSSSSEPIDIVEPANMSEKSHMRRTSKPPPLPDFKFNPGATVSTPSAPSPTHPVLEEMALNQQRASRSARPAPLPVFTFNPGSSTSQGPPSPTKSEHGDDSLRPATGHRRGGSEFVGSSHLVSTSPQKHEHKPSGPPVAGTGHRGHVHRRSQAVSISDIDTSDLIKAHAIAKHRAGSGPSTPNETGQTFSFARPSPQSRHSVSHTAMSPPGSPQRRGSAPGARPRVVEFADKIDVIPRPLSMISSETEGSISTIRGGHSLSNSINSIASPPQFSPPRLSSVFSSPILEEGFSPRPSTADASTLFSSDNMDQSMSLGVLALPKRPLSASGSPVMTFSGSPPAKKKHFWFSHSNETSPSPTPNVGIEDPIKKLPEFLPSQFVDKRRPKTSPERPTTLRQRKYHTWTAGIFSKKTRRRSSRSKGKRTPTPPALTRRDSDKVNDIFDADNTVVLRETSPTNQRKSTTVETSFYLPSTLSGDQVTSPVLDLDAALGPFDSEEKLMEEGSAKGSASRIARLHSSERRGLVDAFGSHRRTESAPSMSPVNRSLFGLNRHGSNASLAEEVFDEEEEDIFLADQRNSTPGSECPEEKHELNLATLTESETATASGLGFTNVSNVTDDVLIVDPESVESESDRHSSKSTIEPRMFVEDEISKRPVASPMVFAYPSTQSQYASSTDGRRTSASMISSPDAEHITFDNHHRFNRFGQSSPDLQVRPSTDDLPSLSDSISSGAIPRISSSDNTRSSTEQRSASMFDASTSRSNTNWKRSSLASLNRLLPGSSNGSKLKFETVPDTTLEEKPAKRRSSRISKLMQFWRTKEKVEK